MEIRNYTSLQAFNKLGMSEFRLHSIEYAENEPFQNAIFLASRGYMEHFGAEIKFIGVEFISSPCFFTHRELYQASPREFPLIQEYPGCNIYCFKEQSFPQSGALIQYYVIARNIKIIVHFAGQNAEAVFRPSDDIEHKYS